MPDCITVFETFLVMIVSLFLGLFCNDCVTVFGSFLAMIVICVTVFGTFLVIFKANLGCP